MGNTSPSPAQSELGFGLISIEENQHRPKYPLMISEMTSELSPRVYDKSPMSLMFKLNIMMGSAISWAIPTRQSAFHQDIFGPVLGLRLV